MFTYREAKQRCLMYGFELYMRDGRYVVANRVKTMTSDDLDECVSFAMGRL